MFCKSYDEKGQAALKIIIQNHNFYLETDWRQLDIRYDQTGQTLIKKKINKLKVL